jgi:hypothetical protein
MVIEVAVMSAERVNTYIEVSDRQMNTFKPQRPRSSVRVDAER